MEKNIYIKDIQDGQNVEDAFLVREMRKAETKAGKPYLMLTLMDRTGDIPARIWDNADQFEKICRQGKIVRVSGQAQSYKNILQLKINDVNELDEEAVNISLFVPATSMDIEQMAAELIDFVKSVANKHLQELLLRFFESKPFFEAFKKAPAAKLMHHAYIGGLLEHSLGITRLADMVCNLYPVIDRSLLIAGAILHDIGKVAEFSFDAYPFDYSDRGRLVGHMVLGIEMVQNRINTLDDFPEETATQLNHLILSHHGRHEFGSPVLPMTREAFVLNFLDELDSKINYFNRLGENAEGEEYQWSEYQKNLERFLFIKGQTGPSMTAETMPVQPKNSSAGTSEGKEQPDVDPRQTNLWK